MAKKSRGDNAGGVTPATNVVNLFGNNAVAANATEEEVNAAEEQIKNMLIGALQEAMDRVNEGHCDGILLLMANSKGGINNKYSAQLSAGGPGVFSQIDKTIGIIERTKLHLALGADEDEDD